MATVANVSTYGQLSTHKVEVDQLNSGQSSLKLVSSLPGAGVDTNRNEITFVSHTTTPTLTFSGVGTAGSTVLLKGLSDPVDPQDAVTKFYADGIAAGIDVKVASTWATAAVLDAVNVPTYANGTAGVGATLTENVTTSGTLNVDGNAVSPGDRVLVKNQVSALTNGIYLVTAATPAAAWVLTRVTDCDSYLDFTPGAFTFVEGGAVNVGRGFAALGAATGVGGGYDVGVDAVNFTQFSAAAAEHLYTLPLQNTAGTVALNQDATNLGVTGGNALAVVGAAGGADQGKMLLGSVNATTASVYSDTYGSGQAGALSLKVEPLGTLSTTVTDANLLSGALQLAPAKTLAAGDYSAGVVMGSNTARNSVVMVGKHGAANVSEVHFLSRDAAADTWGTVAVFSRSTV
jgi:hypothetical protein